MATRPTSKMANRAGMQTFGEIEAPKQFDPQQLIDTAVDGTPPPFTMEGNLDMENPEAMTPGEQPPAAPVAPAPEPEVKEPEVKLAEPDDIDDPRFKGKGKKDIYESYRNLERLRNEKEAELQTYKELYTQKVLKPEMEALQKPAPVVPATNDPTELLNEMLSDPAKYEQRVISKAKKQLFDELAQTATKSEAQQEWTKHRETFNTPEFVTWEKENLTPAMIQAAATDAHIMKFIVTSFKNAQPHEVPAAPQPDRKIPLGSSVGMPAAAKPATTSTQFTTAQLAKMQLQDPDEYQRRQPEILKWYVEQENKKRR